MYKFPIGIITDSFRKPMPEALAMAAKMGAKGVQVYATRGEMSPEELKGQKRRDFLNMVKDNGLVISALCGDLGHGFGNAELNPGLIERSKLILDMAKELETDIVTTHIGVTPVDPEHPRYKIMQDACGQLAEHADSLKAHFATRYTYPDAIAHPSVASNTEALRIRTMWASDTNEQNWLRLPPITLTAEEDVERAELIAQVDTYAKEMLIKFVTGAEPLDNFDAYIEAVEGYGLLEAIEITQGAVDRFYGIE